jgi:hypothetical protein
VSIETVLLAIGASASTTALVVAILRWAGPLVAKLFGSVLKTRAELDSDRDRVIEGLRSEIADWQRRLDAALERATAAEAQAAACREENHKLEEFIDTFLLRMGTTREAVEQGDWPGHPPTRRRGVRQS